MRRQTRNRQWMLTPKRRMGPGCDPLAGCSGLARANSSRACRPAPQSSSRPRRCLVTSVRVISNLLQPRTACHDIPEFHNSGDSNPLPPDRNNSATRESAYSPIPLGPPQPQRDGRACTRPPAVAMSKVGAPPILANGTHFQVPTELGCFLPGSSSYPVLPVHRAHGVNDTLRTFPVNHPSGVLCQFLPQPRIADQAS